MKKILLTGASAGIGRATKDALLAAGHELWGTSRDPSRLPSAERFHPVQLDLTDSHSITTAFEHARNEAGRIDVLINNAGSGHFGPGERISEQQLRDQFQVLVFAQIQLMQSALAHMRENGGGTIINVSSLASRLPVPFMSAYNAAKAAMASFTMSVQLELPGPSIRLIDFQPADIKTEFNDRIRVEAEDPLYRDLVQKTWGIVDQNMKAAPGPEKVARAILALVESETGSPRLTVGGWFQAQVAPFINRFLPQTVRIWGLRQYYRMP